VGNSEKSSRTSSAGLELSGTPGPSIWTSWSRCIPWVIVAILTVTNWYTWRTTYPTGIPGAVFCKSSLTIYCLFLRSQSAIAPASSVIKYKNVVFQAGIDSDTSPYQGPLSKELDLEWEELHKCEYSIMCDEAPPNTLATRWSEQDTDK
jgi:hypothetical protein